VSHRLHKFAGIKAKNFQDFVNIIGKQNLRGTTSSAKDIARDHLIGKGSGSFFSGIGSKLVPKKVSEAIGNQFSKAQEKLTDWDIRGGRAAHNFFRRRSVKKAVSSGRKDLEGARLALTKAKTLEDITKAKSRLDSVKKSVRDNVSRARSEGGKSFINKYQVPTGESKAGVPDTFSEIDLPLATAPLGKVKKAVLPTVGALAITSKLYGDKKESKEGDAMQKNQSERKKELIEKISSVLCDDKYGRIKSESQKNIDIQKISLVVLNASKMLKIAAKENRKLAQENEELISKNAELNSTIHNKEKLDSATKLAHLMNEKCLIKKADIESQIEKVMQLDESGYEMLKTTIENINSDAFTKEGLDNLTFLDKQINMDLGDRRITLEESLSD